MTKIRCRSRMRSQILCVFKNKDFKFFLNDFGAFFKAVFLSFTTKKINSAQKYFKLS
jgi:hypothetical protein